jgi:hypothetical protein
VTSSELLAKQEMKKTNLLYTKNMYTYLSYFSMYESYIVAAGIEALVSGNKFLYACVKDVAIM